MRFIRQFGQPRPDKPAPTNHLKDFWLPLGPILVALAAVFAQMFTSYQNQRLQLQQLSQATQLKETELRNLRELKEYELSFKPKQEAYTVFMKAFNELCKGRDFRLPQNTPDPRYDNMPNLRQAFYGIEPFLSFDSRLHVLRGMEEVEEYYNDVSSETMRYRQCSAVQSRLHIDLSAALFRGTGF